MDSMQGNSFNVQPAVSSGSGDIVLPSNPSRKSQKPLIITLIIIFLSAAIGVGAWLYFSQSKPNDNSEQSSEEVDIKKAFNIYANYLIFGDKNSDKTLDMATIFKDYSLYNPDIYIETANLEEVEAINEAFIKFRDAYDKPATSEFLSKYFYDYEKAKLSNKLELDEYEVLDLREEAMTTLVEICDSIYGVNTAENEEAE